MNDQKPSQHDTLFQSISSAPNLDGFIPDPYLIVLYGRDRGKRILLDKQEIVIGRSKKADFRIDDDKISRIHCKLDVDDKRVLLQDCDSRNGTFINGQKITTVTIDPDCLIRIGSTLMRIDYKSSREVDFEQELFLAATTDLLTELPNRRMFFDRARAEIAYSHRLNVSLSLFMIDIDFFKKVNDTYGHDAGDMVLKGVADILKESVRDEDMICRYGGEEFIILPRCDATQDIEDFGQRIRQSVAEHFFTFNEEQIQVTISIGLAHSKPEDSIEELINKADKALYLAKDRGRNRLEILDD
ncbi:diguanylate cyclase [candidate division CSSED10-310 bacterium]|uniref:Diguanylate cyclase n=1 Tax=candidate division CSSED10-310 bacterium TaxID=2855610 RepID=A0ABV6YX94_UNCC1